MSADPNSGLVPDVADRAGRSADSSLTPDVDVDHGEHRLLGYANAPGPWRFHGADGSDVSVRANGPLTANSGDALVPALIAGLGITRLPAFIVSPYLASGELVAILKDWTPPPIGLHLLTPPSPLRPARVEALIAFLAAHLRDSGGTYV